MHQYHVYFALSLVLALSFVAPARPSGFHELLTWDCQGGLTLFGKHQLVQTKISTPIKLIGDFLMSKLIEDGRCYCPTMTENEFDRVFWFGMVLNKLKGPDMDKSIPCGPEWVNEVWAKGLLPESNFTFNTPAGCDLASWQAGNPCYAKHSFPSFNIDVGLNLRRCPNSWLPFISLVCEGDGCSRFAMPCNSNEECGSPLQCNPITNDGIWVNVTNTTELNWTRADMFNGLKDMRLYDDNDVSPGCLSADVFFEDIISYVRKSFQTVSDPYKFMLNEIYTLRLCFPILPTEIIVVHNLTQPGDTYPTTISQILDINCTITQSTVDSNYIDISCQTLKAWNGALASGEKIDSDARLNGNLGIDALRTTPPVPVESNNMVLLSHTCDNQIDLFPTNPRLNFGLKAPWLNQHLSWFFNKIFAIQSCRAEKRFSQLTWEAFRIRFFDIASIFYQFITPGPASAIPFVLSPAMSDFLIQNVDMKVKFPSTCTYDSWIKDGRCALQWTGLQSLFGVGITLKLYARDCGAFKAPEFHVECAGSGCGLLVSPQPCFSSATCPSGSVCTDMYELIFANVTGAKDIVAAYYTLNASTVDQCTDRPAGRKFIHDAIRFIAGLPPDSETHTTMCLPDWFNRIEQFNMSAWAEAQATVDGNVVTLHTVTEWNPTAVEPVKTVAVSVSVTVTGSPTQAANVIKSEYPDADVAVSGQVVTAKFSGSGAANDAAALSAALSNSGSRISVTLAQSGVQPDGSTVIVDQETAVSQEKSAAVTSGPMFGLAAVGALLVSLFA